MLFSNGGGDPGPGRISSGKRYWKENKETFI